MLRWPKHPLAMARFGLRSAPPAAAMARALFRDDAARALFLGSAAHAITPLGQPLTGAFGTLFGALGMTRGWPVARGGTGSIVAALLSVLEAHGGRVHTGHWVTDLRELPQADAVLLNLTPSQVLRLSGPGAEEIRRVCGISWAGGATGRPPTRSTSFSTAQCRGAIRASRRPPPSTSRAPLRSWCARSPRSSGNGYQNDRSYWCASSRRPIRRAHTAQPRTRGPVGLCPCAGGIRGAAPR